MSTRLISICIVGSLLCSIYMCAQREELLHMEESALDIASLMEEPFGSEIITGIIILESMNNVLSYAAELTPASEPVREQQQGADAESHNNETVNALGMTLRDDTALLVKVWNCTSPSYNHVCEEYEYDREDRVLRHIKYYSNTKGRWEYEYDAEGSLTRETCYELEDDAVRYWIEYRTEKGASVDELCRIGSRYEGEGNLATEIVYNSDDNEVKKTYYREDGTAYWEIEYDDTGHHTREIDYDEQENIVNRREYEYDAAGNITLLVDYDADGKIVVTERYDHDSDTYVDIPHYWLTENKYDAAGNLIKKVDYDYEGSIEDVWEYTYDEAGNLLQNIHNGSVTTENEYNDAGNMFRSVDYDYEGNVEDEWEYTYDEDGHLLKRIYNGSVTKEYTYDSAGNMTKEITDPYTQWKKYEYDSENRIIKMTVQDEDRHEYRCEYRLIGLEE